MLHILVPYEGEQISGAACRTCGAKHPHAHELVIVEAHPSGPPLIVPQHLDPWGIVSDRDASKRRRS